MSLLYLPPFLGQGNPERPGIWVQILDIKKSKQKKSKKEFGNRKFPSLVHPRNSAQETIIFPVDTLL